MKEAVKYYLLAATHGDIIAQTALGIIYLTGENVEKNVTVALNWLQTAANQNDSYTQIILGDMYLRGDDISKNIQEAIRWYLLAAENGNPIAQYKLGNLYSIKSHTCRACCQEPAAACLRPACMRGIREQGAAAPPGGQVALPPEH